jgi:hypothetical protein
LFRGTDKREELYLCIADLSVGILIVASEKSERAAQQEKLTFSESKP